MEIETDYGIYTINEIDALVFEIRVMMEERTLAYIPAKIRARDKLSQRLSSDLQAYEYLTEKEWTKDGFVHHCWFLGRRNCWIYTPKKK